MTASQRIKKPIALLRRVRLFCCDVDGVLTDGSLYYFDDGSEARRFNVKDGLGIQRLMAAGFHVALISASTTPSIAVRGSRLRIPHVLTGETDKLAAVRKLCQNLDISLAETAHIADDLNDLPLLEAVGLPIAVADAVPEVRRAARLITERAGGDAAVREVCEMLLSLRHPPLSGKGRASRSR